MPTYQVYTGSIQQLRFSNTITQEIFLEYHIPHNYLPNSDMFIHVHWSQIVIDSGGLAGIPGTAKWSFDVSYSKGHQQEAFRSPISLFVTQQGSSTQFMHNIGEIQLSAASPTASQLDSNDIEVDGVILIRMWRDPTDLANTLNQFPYVHFVDIHYQSTGIGTRNKAPNFYV